MLFRLFASTYSFFFFPQYASSNVDIPENIMEITASQSEKSIQFQKKIPPDNKSVSTITPFGPLTWSQVSKASLQSDGQFYVHRDGNKALLTINKDLQRIAESQLNSLKHGSGAIVMVDSQTGKILALAEKISPNSPLGPTIIDKAFAPAASLMKIITAVAAMESDSSLTPDTEIPMRGGCGHLHHENWLRSERDRESLSFARAFGISCNTIFARLAIYWAGLERLVGVAKKFYFNTPIPSDLIMETSTLNLPSLISSTTLEVGEVGAGFGASKLNPILAALLSAAAANEGTLMAPYIIEEVLSSGGKSLYKAKPRKLATIFSKDISQKLLVLMQETIMTGTARKLFSKRIIKKGKNRRRVLYIPRNKEAQLEMAGKTGTLSHFELENILYTWFSGCAPLESSNRIAISTLVESPKTSVTRASSLAQYALISYLNKLKHEKVIQ